MTVCPSHPSRQTVLEQDADLYCIVEHLVQRSHSARSMRLVDAEDLVAGSVEYLYLHYDAEIHECATGQRSWGWVLAVVDHRAADWHRKRQIELLQETVWPVLRTDAGFQAVNEAIDTSASPEQGLNCADFRRLMALAVAQLTPQKKELYHLLYEKGFSFEEIGTMCGVSQKTLYKRHNDL